MKHVDMRKLPAAAQEERRRQVIGLRRAGMTYDAIAAQAGLTRTGVFNICLRFAERGAAGLKSGPRGPEPGHGRFLDAEQEAAARDLIRRHTPDELDLPFALWSRAAARELLLQRFGVRLRSGPWAPTSRAGASPPRSRCGGPTSRTRRRCAAGSGGTPRSSRRGPKLKGAWCSGVMRPACARTTCVAGATRPGAAPLRCGSTTSGLGSA